MDVFPRWLADLFFPTKSDRLGRMRSAQLGLCRIEAALLRAGFRRDQVAIVDPRKIDRAVGPNTKVVGIGVLDPLGVNYGTALLRVLLKLMGVETKLQSYMSWATMKLLNHPAIKRFRPRIIVGGQGVWEIIDSGLQKRLGIDCVVEGEGELVAPELFLKAVRGEPLPSYVRGRIVPAHEIPPIVTASRGIVEITRGCGRGCRFCNPTLLAFRSLPKSTILRDIETNLRAGEKSITLHSEDFLRYGAKGLIPDEEKVIDLLETVRKVVGDSIDVHVDFVTPSTAVANKKLVKVSADIMGIQSRFSIIQIGIESASPRIIDIVAPGKPKPFSSEVWPEIVEEAIALLNDCGWWICATIIIGFPWETEEDIEKNIEFVERIKRYNVFVFPLPFIPSGSLRKAKGLRQSDIEPKNPRALELTAIALLDAIEKIERLAGKLTAGAPPIIRNILASILRTAANIGRRRLQRFWAKQSDIK